MPKAQETTLEIDLKALKQNYTHLRSKLKTNTKFLAVVKAFGYGSDSCMVAKTLQDSGADYFAVAYTNEGVALRNVGITTPILILHPQAVNFDILIENHLEPNLYSTQILNAFIQITTEQELENYPVHIKFNTGLNRLGFTENDIEIIVAKLKTTTSVKVASVFSHLAASEDLNEREFTLNQIDTFKHITEKLFDALSYKPILHMCNTSGILNYSEAHFDMVRSGIGLYGFGNSEKENEHLKPIATFKTIVSQIHTIEEGASVGYNRAFISDTVQKTATLPVGHADGIGRQYGNEKGFVVINGQKAPIIGNVCMDMIMINITHINCEEGDEVIIFGQDNTAENLAATTNTISYELITFISQRVKRVYVS